MGNTSGVAEKLAGSVARSWLVMFPAVLFNITRLLLEEVGGIHHPDNWKQWGSDRLHYCTSGKMDTLIH